MENATKALLIAAAVLVAILIISLGLVVYNMAADTIGSVNLSQQEIQQHNDKFTRYEGEAQRGNQVNALLTEVMNHNAAQTDSGRMVAVYVDNNVRIDTSTTVTKSPQKVDTGHTYKVEAVYDPVTDLIIRMNVTDNSTPAGGGS